MKSNPIRAPKKPVEQMHKSQVPHVVPEDLDTLFE